MVPSSDRARQAQGARRQKRFAGWFQTLGHVLLVAITGAATWYFFDQRIWVGFAIALFAHGTMYSFLGGLATHELSHGTVFKTKWLNSLFLRFLSLISWVNFHDRIPVRCFSSLNHRENACRSFLRISIMRLSLK